MLSYVVILLLCYNMYLIPDTVTQQDTILQRTSNWARHHDNTISHGTNHALSKPNSQYLGHVKKS